MLGKETSMLKQDEETCASQEDYYSLPYAVGGINPEWMKENDILPRVKPAVVTLSLLFRSNPLPLQRR